MLENLGIGSRISHSQFGKGVVVNEGSVCYTVCFIDYGLREINKSDEAEIIDMLDPDTDPVSLFDVERIFKEVLKKYADFPEIVELGQKWTGGKIILQPGDRNLAQKEIPIEQLFHKIVMIRDRLRTIEQRINSHTLLTDEDKLNLQQYITRCYGSLTTFNILFKNEKDRFTGEKGE